MLPLPPGKREGYHFSGAHDTAHEESLFVQSTVWRRMASIGDGLW